MHRRQYIPGNHVKVSRTRLAQENQQLVGFIRAKAADEKRRAEEVQERERARQATGVRGFINKAKRFLTQPILSKRSA